MRELAIDIETYSGEDLTKTGVYKYAEHPDFCILLFSYAVDRGEVRCVDLAKGENLPDEIRKAITDHTIIKTAYNAAFERVCLSHYLGMSEPMSAEGWRCTMAAAAKVGLPLGLDTCGKALNIEKQKDRKGAALIRYFSIPDKNGKRRMPESAPDKWEEYKRYNIRDVEAEQEILQRIETFEDTDIKGLYELDQRINDRGVLVDRTFVSQAVELDQHFTDGVLKRMQEITGLENPNSATQLKEWIKQRTGVTVEAITKGEVAGLIEGFKYWPEVQEVLRLRLEAAKTSNKKYQAMAQCMCKDDRIRGLMQYYGAARTGRWAGRLVQVQNLPQNHITDIDTARDIVKQGDAETLELYYQKPTQILSELIRTAFIAPKGYILQVCDFSAIEARVIAWLAGENWVLDTFKQGKDIYCATAEKMFHVPVQKHGENAELRQKGKIAQLALGYGGGVAALKAMGGERMGLSDTEMGQLVNLWRKSNPNIVKMWRNLEAAAKHAIETGAAMHSHRGIIFEMKRGVLCVTLPSGRTLCYMRAKVENGEITYEGVVQTTGGWGKLKTYGGKITENIVQGVARDILAETMIKADKQGVKIVFHVHDELVTEAPEGKGTELLEKCFCTAPDWCADLPLKGAAYETYYYLKD